MSRRRSRTAGFTLLELLVGLVVFSLLAATAYAALRTSATGWERAEQRIDDREARRAVRDFVRRQLNQAAPLARIERGRWTVWFEGERGRLVFLTELPAWLGEGGIHEAALEVKQVEGVTGLTFTRQRLDAAATPGEFRSDEVVERTLVPGVKRIAIDYFGARRQDDAPDWSSKWVAERRLPSLVRVQVFDADGEAWLPIVGRVRADAVRFLRSSRERNAGGRQSDSESDQGALSDEDVNPDAFPADIEAGSNGS